MTKLSWSGRIISVQPRIRLTRSFDQRSHTYLGYSLVTEGVIDGQPDQFSIGIGKAAHQRHQFQVGDEVRGESLPVADVRLEPVAYYQTSKLKVLSRFAGTADPSPPWHGVPIELMTTGPVDTGVCQSGPTTGSVRVVSGAVGCRW